jgi:cell pole-organizing protein PopZ
MPVWVTVLGLLLVAVIVVWIIFAMTFSDTGARVAATQTAEAAAAAPSEPTATDTPLPTETPAPAPSATPSLVATSTPEPAPTNTPEPPAPTDTPEPEPSPTDTPAPEPTATETPAPTATPPAGEWALLSPAIGDPATTGPTPFNFEWQWSEPLEPGQGFEIRVWREGQGPQGAHDAVADNAAGLIKQVDETAYSFELDISNAANVQNVSSVYNWSVALVQFEPEYKDLGQQAEPGILQYIGTRGPEDVAPQPAPETPAEASPEEAPVEESPAADEPTPESNAGG